MNKIYFLTIVILVLGCSSQKTETANSKSETKKDSNDYYKNGNIRIERKRLENGDSLWIFKQEDGGCWEDNFYRDGEIYKKIVYNSDCTKSAEYELKNGKRHGEWINYHNNGKIWEKGKYQNGLPSGLISQYNDEGKLQKRIVHLKMIVDNLYPFTIANNFDAFKKALGNQSGIIIEMDKKVAGNEEYDFPIIKWLDNELRFDYLSENDTLSKLNSARITDQNFKFLKSFKIGCKANDLVKFLNYDLTECPDEIVFYDLKETMTYRFEFENKKLIAINFERTNLAN